jgi:hypothetical protein
MLNEYTNAISNVFIILEKRIFCNAPDCEKIAVAPARTLSSNGRARTGWMQQTPGPLSALSCEGIETKFNVLTSVSYSQEKRCTVETLTD